MGPQASQTWRVKLSPSGLNPQKSYCKSQIAAYSRAVRVPTLTRVWPTFEYQHWSMGYYRKVTWSDESHVLWHHVDDWVHVRWSGEEMAPGCPVGVLISHLTGLNEHIAVLRSLRLDVSELLSQQRGSNTIIGNIIFGFNVVADNCIRLQLQGKSLSICF